MTERKLGPPREAWLRGTDEQWAEAMMRCQHPAGFCGQDGFCHFDGDCFGGNADKHTKRAKPLTDTVALGLHQRLEHVEAQLEHLTALVQKLVARD